MNISHKIDNGCVVKTSQGISDSGADVVVNQVYTPADIQKGIDTCKAYIAHGSLSEVNLKAVEAELKMWQSYGSMVENDVSAKIAKDTEIVSGDLRDAGTLSDLDVVEA